MVAFLNQLFRQDQVHILTGCIIEVRMVAVLGTMPGIFAHSNV